MTTARDLKQALLKRMVERSGLEAHRHYLGMSAIHDCPRQLYNEFLMGRHLPKPGHHWRCWLGLLHEAGIGTLMDGLIERYPVALVADFDSRYQGHVDFQTVDGECLVEIKTVTWEAFCGLRYNSRIPERHVSQVQAYLQHGPWNRAILLYLARDAPNDRLHHIPVWTFEVRHDPPVADRLDAKAKRILDAIDHKSPPACLCGRHQGGVNRV